MTQVITQPKTLSINTTVQVTEVVEAQIELPYFCKSEDGTYYFVESEEKTTTIKHYDSIGVVDMQTGPTSYYKAAIARAVAVSEEDFDMQYKLANSLFKHTKAA